MRLRIRQRLQPPAQLLEATSSALGAKPDNDSDDQGPNGSHCGLSQTFGHQHVYHDDRRDYQISDQDSFKQTPSFQRGWLGPLAANASTHIQLATDSWSKRCTTENESHSTRSLRKSRAETNKPARNP